MSNDENKSLQQNLPLSWEEDSQNNLEEEVPQKKLLLRREEIQAEDVPAEEAPKPLLLKKAPEEYREKLDNLDTIYDKEIPANSDEDTETDEEWTEEEDFDDLDEEEFDEQAELDEDISGAEDETEDNDSSEEEDFDDLDEEEFDEQAELDEDISDAEDETEDNDSSEEEYNSAFEDSGTFTLDETPEEGEAESFEEDEIDDSRIEIQAESFSELSADESAQNIEEEVQEEENRSLPEEKSPLVEDQESVFALKADTYYEVQTENKAENNENVEDLDEGESEVVQDYDVKTLGTLLQEARLSCSFTIKDAAEATRIKSSYIIALENNEMEELPAKVYVLNYIRQLCREYNVPNEPIIEAFERQNNNNKTFNGTDVKIMRVGDEDARKATKPSSKINALVVGSSLLTLAMLFLIGWYMKWFNPTSSPENINIEIQLEEMRPEIKLPAPELPIPNQ